MRSDEFSSESGTKLSKAMNEDEDSFILDTQIQKKNEYKLFITKRRSFSFYMKIFLVCLLTSLYYCLILSMDEEIELVISKIFQSILLLVLTGIEVLLQKREKPISKIFYSKKDDNNRITLQTPLLETSPKKGLEYSAKNEYLIEDIRVIPNKYDKYYIDRKELLFYDVIFGMLSFTSELLLYYFLSLASNANVNIGTMYCLVVFIQLFLIARIPYFKVKLGCFQIIGIAAILAIMTLILLYYIPYDYNIAMLLGTILTICLFKFINYCIIEYIHEKTMNANLLIREGNIFDGAMGLLLLVFILLSRKNNLIISDLGNWMKVGLGSFFYYFALKISIYKEENYYLYVVFGGLNFFFISIFDYVINGRTSQINELILIILLSMSSILSFIHDKSFLTGWRNIFSSAENH
jgi:hypothetical protein